MNNEVARIFKKRNVADITLPVTDEELRTLKCYSEFTDWNFHNPEQVTFRNFIIIRISSS